MARLRDELGKAVTLLTALSRKSGDLSEKFENRLLRPTISF